MEVNFDAVRVRPVRTRFMDTPTTFVLPAEDVDPLRETGGRLLGESEDYRSLLPRNGRLACQGGSSPALTHGARSLRAHGSRIICLRL
jgi:hypothetical protein